MSDVYIKVTQGIGRDEMSDPELIIVESRKKSSLKV